MRLLEDIFDDGDKNIIPSGTKIQIIDEGVLDWLSTISTGVGAGIKHAGKFVLKLIGTLANSGIKQSDFENITHAEIPSQYTTDIKTEIKAYEDKYNIQNKSTRKVIINLIKMKHLNPEMKDNAEKALKEITSKLELKQNAERQ